MNLSKALPNTVPPELYPVVSYDELGNIGHVESQGRWNRIYTYDTNTNRLLNTGSGLNYTYDAHGNMVSMPHLGTMEWDYRGNLTKTIGGTVTTYYRYDPNGNRVRKIAHKTGAVTEERIYIGNYELYRKKVGGTLNTERETTFVSDDQKRIAIVDTRNVPTPVEVIIRFQYENHLGSACLELDEDAVIISYEEYHPFGTTSYRAGRNAVETSLKRYKYVGKERDEETGLYYYGARYYAAWLCRFVSVDPLQFKYPHYTPYQYAGNKAVSFIDLDGLEEAKNITHFFSNRTGKYLGQVENVSEPATEDQQINGMVLRTIGESDFEQLKKEGEGEKPYNVNITRDTKLISIDQESYKNFEIISQGGNIEGAKERSLYIVLDLSDNVIKSIINPISNESTDKKVSNRTLEFLDFKTMINNTQQIIVGQSHTHTLFSGSLSKPNTNYSTVTISSSRIENSIGVSTEGEESDLFNANQNGYPYYAIQMFDKSGNIFKVDQYGNLKTNKGGIQIPIANLQTLNSDQFNILLDAFLTYSGFTKK